MLETIREFAEEQLVARGEEDQARTAHARYFAGRETDILALWDSLRQREAHDWFTRRLGAVDPDWLSAAIPLLAPAGKPRETLHRQAIGLSRAVRHRNERSRSDPTGTDPSSRSRALASRTRPNRVLTTRTSRGRTSAEAIATQDNGLTFPIASR
jgi:hypothetical protein